MFFVFFAGRPGPALPLRPVTELGLFANISVAAPAVLGVVLGEAPRHHRQVQIFEAAKLGLPWTIGWEGGGGGKKKGGGGGGNPLKKKRVHKNS